MKSLALRYHNEIEKLVDAHNIWLLQKLWCSHFHNFPGLYYRPTLVLEMDNMEMMYEGPDVRSLADVHALCSALLFLTRFFEQFSPVLILFPQIVWKCHSSKPKQENWEYLTTASFYLSCMMAVSLMRWESSNQSYWEDSFLSPDWRVQLSHPKQIHCYIAPITELEGSSFAWLLVHQYHHLKPKIFFQLVRIFLILVFSFFLNVLWFCLTSANPCLVTVSYFLPCVCRVSSMWVSQSAAQDSRALSYICHVHLK